MDNTPNNFPIGFSDFSELPVPANCSATRTKYLAATKDTIHWGYV